MRVSLWSSKYLSSSDIILHIVAMVDGALNPMSLIQPYQLYELHHANK